MNSYQDWKIGEELTNFNSDRVFHVGDVVQHFKRETLGEKDDKRSYLYQIVGTVLNTTNNLMPMILYKSLINGSLYVRDFQEFFSKVDKKKYPDIKQEYRFEVV